MFRLRQPKSTTVTFMADERHTPTEDEGERPSKMRPIWSLTKEKIEEESEDRSRREGVHK